MATRVRQPQLPAAAYTPINEHYQQWSLGNIGRTVGLSVAVLSTTLGNWPEQAPPAAAAISTVGATSPDWVTGIPTRPKRLTTALLDSGFKPIMPPRVPEKEFQEGWRSRFTEPVVLGKKITTASADTGWMPRMPPRVPEKEYQEGWRHRWTDPPTLQKPRPSVETLGDIAWPGVGYSAAVVQTPSTLWWPNWQGPPAHLYAQRSRELLTGGGVAWPAQVPTVQYQEGWRQEFSRPVRLSPQPRLEGQISWPGIGYSFAVVVAPPSDWWYERWQAPPKTAQRSSELYGDTIIWSPQTPPAAVQYGVHSQQHRYQPRQRSQDLLTGWPWPGYGYSFAAPALTPSDWWRTQWSDPPKRAAPRQEGFVAWPGIGYSFAVVVAPPSDWWYERWQNPPQLLSPRPRARELYGDTKPDGPRIPDVVYQEGWRSSYSVPPQTWTIRRQQGFVAFAGTQGLPVTLSPGPWSPVPAATFLAVRTRIVTAWPWQALQFTPPTPTPSIWWRTQWTDPPKAKARAVYLRDDSWGSWAPQFIIQIVPPPALAGVTFTFGVKPGPSAVPGTKPGATLQSQRKGGGFSLITRVKPS